MNTATRALLPLCLFCWFTVNVSPIEEICVFATYDYNISNPKYHDGEVLSCHGMVSTTACIGMCESSEVSVLSIRRVIFLLNALEQALFLSLCKTKYIFNFPAELTDNSPQIPDYRVPFKISRHRVCTFGGRVRRMVRLSNCHPNHPEPEVPVYDATDCVCRVCDRETTHCRHS
jgi:hypothetical protein